MSPLPRPSSLLILNQQHPILPFALSCHADEGFHTDAWLRVHVCHSFAWNLPCLLIVSQNYYWVASCFHCPLSTSYFFRLMLQLYAAPQQAMLSFHAPSTLSSKAHQTQQCSHSTFTYQLGLHQFLGQVTTWSLKQVFPVFFFQALSCPCYLWLRWDRRNTLIRWLSDTSQGGDRCLIIGYNKIKKEHDWARSNHGWMYKDRCEVLPTSKNKTPTLQVGAWVLKQGFW